jgi:hypothetical protein
MKQDGRGVEKKSLFSFFLDFSQENQHASVILKIGTGETDNDN